jgi:DNA-binding protein YbaB
MEADVEGLARAYRAVEGLVVSVASEDQLVRVSVGAAGNLQDLRLDPQIGRRPDGAALARTIVRVAGEALANAAVRAGELFRPLMPGGPVGAGADVMFAPALAQLDRLEALPATPARADERPVVPALDVGGLRDDVLRERERLLGVRKRRRSPDGLVAATVGGWGELIALSLDGRVFQRSDSRWLARTIVATVRS